MSRERNIVYDWLRVIATLMVLIGHSSYLNIHTEIGGISYILHENINPVYYSWPFMLFRKLSGAVYGFHMPLFFMLSGAVLALNDDKDFDSFVSAKIKRLIIPYFVCGLGFMLPVKYLGNFYTSDNFMAAVKSFLVGGESGHLWFLPALFWCTVSFSIARRLLLSKGVKSVYALTLLCVICVKGGGALRSLILRGLVQE